MMLRMQSPVVKAVQSLVPKFGALQHGIVDVQTTQTHQGQQIDKLVTLVAALADHSVGLQQRLDNLENQGTVRTSVSAVAAANSPVAAAANVAVFPAANAVPAANVATDSAALLQARTDALTAPTLRHPIALSTTPVDLKTPVERSQPGDEPGEVKTTGSAVTFFLRTACGRKVQRGEIHFKNSEQRARAKLCCQWFKAIATQVRARAGTPHPKDNQWCTCLHLAPFLHLPAFCVAHIVANTVTLNLLSQEEQAAFMFDKYEAGAAVMKAGYLHKLIVGKLVQCFTDKQLAVPKKLRTLSAGDGFLQISSFHTFVTDQLVKQHEYAHNQLLASLPAYRQDQERKAQAILNPPASSSSPKKSPKKSPASSPNKSPNRSPNKSHASSSSPNQGTKRPAAAADAGPSNPRKSHKKRSQVQSTLNFA